MAISCWKRQAPAAIYWISWPVGLFGENVRDLGWPMHRQREDKDSRIESFPTSLPLPIPLLCSYLDSAPLLVSSPCPVSPSSMEARWAPLRSTVCSAAARPRGAGEAKGIWRPRATKGCTVLRHGRGELARDPAGFRRRRRRKRRCRRRRWCRR